MPLVRTVERKIRNVEGFDIKFLHLLGKKRDVRGDRRSMPGYPFMKALKGSKTVSAWKRQRLLPNYPGFDCEVLGPDGIPISGQTKLTTLRDKYLDD